jgi:hypothetical protein
MAGRADAQRRADLAVAGELAAGETRLAVTVLRGAGLSAAGDAEWVLAATDRRVLLLTLGTRRQPPVLVTSAPLGQVRVLDAQLRGATPSLVLRFPDARIGWFIPIAAWRNETAEVVDVLGLATADGGEAYPSEVGYAPDAYSSDRPGEVERPAPGRRAPAHHRDGLPPHHEV